MNLITNSRKYTSDFFNKGHQRTIAAKKNIAASLIIKGASIIINLALVPLTINYVNPTQYGIWLTLSSIIAWFSFFDIGFGHGLRNRFAESIAAGNVKKAQQYVSTTYAVLSIIFFILWILFSIINFFIDWSSILNAPLEMQKELYKLSFIVFSFLCIRIVAQTINTIVTADQKPAMAGFINLLGQLLALFSILGLTLTTKGSLINLGIALGFAPVFILLISSLFLYNRRYKVYAPSLNNIDFSLAHDIMSLGIKFFLIQFGAIILFQTTNIVITNIMGPENVTVYNIAFKYFSVVSMFFYIILTPFWSAFTEAFQNQDYNWMKNTILQLKKIWLLSLPASVIMLLVSNYAYRYWIGNAVEVPVSVSMAMVILILLSMRYNLFIYPLNGTGKIKLQLYINIFFSLVYIPLAVVSCKKYGLVGIIGANIFVAAIHAVTSQLQMKMILENKARGIWNQ